MVFFNTDFLEDEEIKLVVDRVSDGNPERNWVPAYYFNICDKEGRVMGCCDLRVGYNENTYYGGHIGYSIDEPYRGHHFAAKACRLLFSLAKKHGMEYVIITCNPDNYASRKTCEHIKGKLLEIAELPEDNDMRVREGDTHKCIFRFDLITEAKELAAEFAERSKKLLKDNLVGVYLHGSAVMGCFNPAKSDIDLIVVVNSSMTDATKRELMDMVVELNKRAPEKGIEMSIVKKDACKPFVYPTPFELHFSAMHISWYHDNPEDYIEKMNGTDVDLAAHFTVIKKCGKCLYGAPIDEVFGVVPKADYLDSIRNDIADAREDIVYNTMYITLNLARVLAYSRDGLVLSKKEGGEWALGNLPERYHSLIKEALNEYEKGAEPAYDKKLAQRYADYMLSRIFE